jgi:hypothetical protein
MASNISRVEPSLDDSQDALKDYSRANTPDDVWTTIELATSFLTSEEVPYSVTTSFHGTTDARTD